MKKFIILVVALIVGVSTYADVTRTGNTFKTEKSSTSNGTQTKYTWEDKNSNKYPIYITSKGACYILKVSKKTEKEYKYYLPKDVQEQIRKELNIQVDKE